MSTRGFYFTGAGTPPPASAVAGYVGLGTDTGQSAYPVTNGAVSAGVVGAYAGDGRGFGVSEGWVSGDDARLQYTVAMPFSAGDGTIRVRLDLSGPGLHAFRIASGGRAYFRSRWKIIDSDGTTVLYSVTGPDIGEPAPARQYVGTDGALHAFGDPNPVVQASVSGSFVYLESDTPGPFRGTVSYFEATKAGPTISGIAPSVGRATGTVVDVTVGNSVGVTQVAIGGVPLSGLTIVNGTTVRGTTASAVTGPVTVTNADGTSTGPTFTVVPLADAARIISDPFAVEFGVLAPAIVVEAYNTTTNERDILYTGPLSLAPLIGGGVVIASGTATKNATGGLATFDDIVFAEGEGGGGPAPDPDPVIPQDRTNMNVIASLVDAVAGTTVGAVYRLPDVTNGQYRAGRVGVLHIAGTGGTVSVQLRGGLNKNRLVPLGAPLVGAGTFTVPDVKFIAADVTVGGTPVGYGVTVELDTDVRAA